jgi:hypothetical protein
LLLMTRRDFVTTTLAAGGSVMAAPMSAAAGGQGTAEQTSPEFYELRRYTLRRGPATARMDAYLRDALIPACGRAGTGPVGVFNVSIGPSSPSTYVLIPHKTAEGYAHLPGQLAADAAYLAAGNDYLGVAATDPAFTRVESSLMRAFAGMPRLALPFGGGEAGRRSRLFELRIYESHSEQAARKKIEMFNIGEIDIFRKAGLMPVFFGETLVGPSMPNLTYMLVYEDMAARDKYWSTFVAMPEWRKLSTTPGYTDPEIVSNITNMYLRPAAYSQI